MRKIYFTLYAVLCIAFVSSCQNGDIDIDKIITFKINPSTVVSSLLENSPGDLSSVGNDKKLHVGLYVYNEAGSLVAKDIQQFSDYTHIMNSAHGLGTGEYTIVAYTQIIWNDGTKFWTISGENNLSTFTVTDEGMIGGSSKILGLSAKKILIDESTKEISMNVECAGAVALVEVLDWNRYSDVKQYGLASNKSCDDVKFGQNGQLSYSITTKSTFAYWMYLCDYDSKYKSAYGYTFMFPYTDIKMTFEAITDSDETVQIGTTCTADILKGHTYWFAYDVTEEETYWSDATDWKSYSASPRSVVEGIHENKLPLTYSQETGSIRIAE